MSTDYAHMPLMQRPDFRHSTRKHVRAKLVRVGDEVWASGKRRGGDWRITSVEVTEQMVWVTYEGISRRMGLGPPDERVWVERIDEDQDPLLSRQLAVRFLSGEYPADLL